MIYFANPTAGTHDLMASHILGWADSPISAQRQRPPGVIWCADNGCFSNRFNETKWWNWLQRNATDAATCIFATAPDVVGDASETLQRSLPWLPRIRDLGYRAAFVAQDGQDQTPVPWNEFDVLFIGGTTQFKLGPVSRALVYEAKRHNKWVHCGRVNSHRRFRWAEAIGCDSADGTYLTFGPDTNLPKLLRWVHDIKSQPALFGVDT